MKKPSKEQKEFEAELIYYLRLYSELKGREGAAKILASIEEEINKLSKSSKNCKTQLPALRGGEHKQNRLWQPRKKWTI